MCITSKAVVSLGSPFRCVLQMTSLYNFAVNVKKFIHAIYKINGEIGSLEIDLLQLHLQLHILLHWKNSLIRTYVTATDL